MSTALPVLFFDRELPDEFRDLVEGRAIVVGPDQADLTQADAIIAGMHPWGPAEMALGQRLRVISRLGVGYDTVDVAAATAAGIKVCYAPQAPTVSTAEHTIALMLAVAKDLAVANHRAIAGLAGGPATGLELDRRMLGLVGFGRIARRVALVGAAFGMKVVAFDPLLDAATPVAASVSLVQFEELLALSDVVSLHAPALPSTRHLINDATLALMKRGSILINCARGALVDQDALLRSLEAGHLGGAGLDVTEPEPLPVGHPLLTHPRVLVTPHIASGTLAGRRRLYEHAIEHALATLAGVATSLVPEQNSTMEGH